MMPEGLTPRERLHWLTREVAAGHLTVDSFCEAFEHIYNRELAGAEMNPVERKVFGELFEKVVWYSPFPEERAAQPHDLGEREIIAAVEAALRQLQT